jgi:hypothetical protein
MSLPAPTIDQSVAELVETVLIKGDLSKLTVAERNNYYRKVCESTGLNPLTRPLEYLTLSGKMVLYARKDCTDQLRTIHKVSVVDVTTAVRGDVYVVTTKVANAEGRTDMATGVVAIGNLKGDALANALMKAETKAKRRATLSICGLGLLDETEIETIPGAQRPPAVASRPIPPHDPTTGELHDELPEHSAPPVPNEAGAPMPNRTDGDGAPAETDSERIVRFDHELRAAAEQGTDELKRQWLLIPTHDRAALKSALDKRHKPHAEEVDAARLL